LRVGPKSKSRVNARVAHKHSAEEREDLGWISIEHVRRGVESLVHIEAPGKALFGYTVGSSHA
jgi:hypothetical protein